MTRFLAVFLILVAGLERLDAQDLPGAKKRNTSKPEVKILAVRPEKTDVAPGETVKVAFDLEIPKGWHIYPAGKKPLFGLPTKFAFDNAEVAGALSEPAPKLVNEKGIGDIDYHEGKITVTVPVKLKADAKGAVTVTGKLSYQICDPSVCVDNATAISFDLKATAAATPAPELPALPGKIEAKIASVSASKTQVQVGEPFIVSVHLEIPEGWHLYPTTPTTTGTPTELKLTGAEPAGKAGGPPTKTHPAEKGQEAYEYLDGNVTLTFPMRLKDGAAVGPLDLEGKLVYQICSNVCIPRKTPVALKLTVLEGKVAAAEVDAIPAAPSGPRELQEGLWKFLLIAVVGGLASLLQPCVFPLMPVTITYFIKQADGSRAKSIFLSVVYAVGLILSFTAIGIVFSLALGADGARIFATKWYVNVIVALLFLWFGFSLFGLYDISLPSWLVGGLTNKQRQGAGGSFILGMLFSVVTFTCTVPIAGLILAASASSDSRTRFMGIVGMLVYSSVMAVPFVVMGVFPSLISTVRKSSGDWLHTVKVTMGFIELPVALFYLSKADTVAGVGILTRWVMISIWVATLGFTILYLLRVFQLTGDEADPAPAADGAAAHPVRRQIGIPRLLVALTAGVLMVSFASGYDGRPLGWLDGVLPPNTEPARTAGVGGPAEGVIESYDAALAEAKKTGKPVFLEFTGVTCTNCQVMKGTVLASPAVRALLAKFVFAELYTDRQNDPKHAAGDEENRKLLVDKFQGYALPFYMTLGPDGVERSRILGKVSEAEFIEFLQKGLSPGN